MTTEISRREDKLVYTLVEMAFANGEVKEVEVAHFNPQSEADIELGISNRFITEQNALTNI